MKVLPYGEDGVYVDLGAGDDSDRAARTHALASALQHTFPAADVVAGAGVVAVFGAPLDLVSAAVAAPPEAHVRPAVAPLHLIDVVHDGPDLDEVAARLGATRDQVIELHTAPEYTVEVVGFLPGFAYLAGLDPRLVLPRRPSPRPRVPAGSVAIAGTFSGIYPLASPGGWHLLGRSPGPPPFDPRRAAPFLFAVGDRVRFRSVAGGALQMAGDLLDPNHLDPNDSNPMAAAALVVVRSPGPATVQDAGRRGWLGRGMPPSGPLDPGMFQAAQRAVGNPTNTAAIELLGGAIELRARGRVVVSVDGASACLLADGDTLRIEAAPRAVRYLAVAGGIDVPVVVGARSTLLSAKLGGLGGRALRRGDVLPIGATESATDAHPSPTKGDTEALASPAADGESATAPILVDPGPHLDRFPATALELFLAAEWRVSHLTDRVGTRLEGASVPRSGPDLAAPVPMRRGAVQVTTDGTPIVLGPDHPTTGGYPVLAVVRAESFGLLARKRPGANVYFRLATRPLARRAKSETP